MGHNLSMQVIVAGIVNGNMMENIFVLHECDTGYNYIDVDLC